MKYHKIRGVDLCECTAEQKIAYNLAFRAHISFQDEFDKAKSLCAVCVDQLVSDIVAAEMRNYKNAYTYKPGKYDEDAIFCALNAGLAAYLERPFIASDYKQIGTAFPALYLNQ